MAPTKSIPFDEFMGQNNQFLEPKKKDAPFSSGHILHRDFKIVPSLWHIGCKHKILRQIFRKLEPKLLSEE